MELLKKIVFASEGEMLLKFVCIVVSYWREQQILF